MSRAEALALHLGTLLVGATGLLYAWMRYALAPTDPFAVVNHPWQPLVQHLHVLTAPVLLFALGLAWRAHVDAGLRLGVRERRRSGAALALCALPLVASGYLLQTTTAPEWRRVWLAVHLTTGALWLGGYLVHQLSPRPVGAEGEHQGRVCRDGGTSTRK